MPFSSINFVFLLPILLMVYWALPDSLKRFWLLVGSIVVYMAAGWEDLALLVTLTGLNWLSHRLMPDAPWVRRTMIVVNILFLGWFKYRFFLADAVGLQRGPGDLIIPLGISFYVFQLISYQVEILKGVLTQTPSFFAFFLYIFFFPHHQAGPIMRPHAFLGAFLHGRRWHLGRFKIGLIIFTWGLFKKVWIADFLLGDRVRELYQVLGQSHGASGSVWLLAVTYGIQIYADFSGYSDIAVGVGRMFGFKLDRNFHQPYLAVGPSQFWRKWHITLSAWLRDTIYIPLGGNRGGKGRARVNLMIVMLVGGLWHGAGWAFLLWGFLHGAYLILEQWTAPVLDRVKPLKFILFQLLFMLAWIPFRENNIHTVLNLFSRPSAWIGWEALVAGAWLAAILAFSWAEDAVERRFIRLVRWTYRLPDPVLVPAYSFLLYMILSGVRYETTFIYQRF